MERVQAERPLYWKLCMWTINVDEHGWEHLGRAARLHGQWLVGAHQVNWDQIFGAVILQGFHGHAWPVEPFTTMRFAGYLLAQP